MPTKIENIASKSLKDRILEFSNKLPDGEGWSVQEIATKLNAAARSIRDIAPRIAIKRNGVWFFVNPKTRQKYANKN